MPGTVVRVSAAAGDEVEVGDVVLVLEAMKMEHSINAPTRGVIDTLNVVVGDSVDQNDVLAVVEAAGPSPGSGRT
jgi:propionyl-CoA carboxylase alpha chain